MTKLYTYQKEGVKLIRRFKGRCLLADDTGLGKSLQALTYAKEDDLWPCVIVCPAFLKPNWVSEVRKHLNMRPQVLEGRTPIRHSLLPPHDIIIVNYDILHNWKDFLIDIKPQLIIFDEGRAIKTPKAKRTQAAYKIVRGSKVPHVVIPDATPIENRPSELYPLLYLLRPDKFRDFRAYAFKFCRPRYTPWGWKFDGAANLKVLNRKLRNICMVRRLKKDVLKDLPEKRHLVVPLEIVNRKQYNQELQDTKQWIRNAYSKGTVSRVEERGKYMQLLQKTAMLKLPAIVEWIDNYLEQTDEKLLVFGIHRAVLETLHETYDNSLLLYGSTTKKERQRIIYDFEHAKKKRLLFGNMTVAGAGWSCKATSTVVTVELPWGPGMLEQLTSRVHGLERGVKGRGVTCYYLVAEGTVEEGLMKMIQKKEGIVNETLDGSSDTQNNISLHDNFRRLILGKGLVAA